MYHLIQTTPTKFGQVWYPCQSAVGNGSFQFITNVPSPKVMAKFIVISSKPSATNPGVYSNAVSVLPDNVPDFVIGTKAWLRTSTALEVGSSFNIPDNAHKLVEETNDNGTFYKVMLGAK